VISAALQTAARDERVSDDRDREVVHATLANNRAQWDLIGCATARWPARKNGERA